VSRIILIDGVYPEETRVVIHENNLIQEFDYETAAKKQIKGNIYLAKVTRVEPSLQAAFIDYGGGKHGFLPFNEIHQDYFNIPISDRKSSNEDQEEFSHEEITNKIRSIEPPVFSNEEIEEVVTDTTVPDEVPCTIDQQIIIDQEVDLNQQEKLEEDDQDQDAEEIERDEIEDKLVAFNPYKSYNIQEVIKKNQVIVVQAIKEERGNKGATFTSFISLAGRYCVLMPNSDKQSGISRRIDNFDDRKRLKSIISSLTVPSGVSVIVRTAGCSRTRAEITRDYDYLVRLWNNIRDHILRSKAPSFIHEEGDLIKRTIRDLYDNTIDEILVQGDVSFKQAKEFIKMIIPTHAHKVKQYRNKVPIFCKYQIDGQLSDLYSTIAELKSGGYIVINQTEALISIDVNSGRSTSERNIEETATKTNLEAVYEAARQLRLRDLSGLIVIDFIDMIDSRNRKLIEREMRDALQNDRAKIQLGSISSFGLFEMSRQRLRPSFIEANSIKCGSCNGKGTVRAPESNAVLILRTIENEICKGDYEQANLYTHPDVAIYLLNYKRKDIAEIESRYRTKIMFYQDVKSTPDSFSIERIKSGSIAKQDVPMNVAPIYDDGSIIDDQDENNNKSLKKNWKNRTINSDEVEEKSVKPPYNPSKRFNKKPIKNNAKEAVIVLDEVAKEEVKKENPNKKETYAKRRRKFNRDRTTNNTINETTTTAEQPSLLKGLWRRIVD
jgi:ribonuclease E